MISIKKGGFILANYVHVIPHQVIVNVAEANEIPPGVELIQAPKIWSTTKGKGITVAVLDTGCDHHPELTERMIEVEILPMMIEAIQTFS